MLMLLKKFFSRLLFPLPLGLELLVAGFVLWRFTRRKRLGQGLVVAGTLWIALVGYGAIPAWLLPRLTEQYPPVSAARLREANPRWIAVPGMGVHFETGYPANLRLSTDFIQRLLEAVRIQRLFPEAQILVSVSNTDMEPAEKQAAMTEFMELLRVDLRKVTMLTGLGDTDEEIKEFQRRSGGESVCLVSSAVHLPRAMVLARRHGMNALASPATQGGIPPDPRHRGTFTIVDMFPSAGNVGATELVIYEYLGLALEWMKGVSGAGRT